MSHRYSLGAGGYVGLPLPSEMFSRLPDSIIVEGVPFLKKDAFHVSLISLRDSGAPMFGTPVSIDSDAGRLSAVFDTYVTEHPIEFLRFLPDFRLAQKDDRTSVVVRCEVSNLEGLFATMQTVLGHPIPLQPTHVTIYTKTPNGGIGINSEEFMEALPRIELPEVAEVLL